MFVILYLFIVFFGVVGNGIVIIIVCKMLLMYIIINYLLMNLVVVDLLILFFCFGVYDFVLNYFRINFVMGDMVCKLFVGNVIVCIIFDVFVLMFCVIVLDCYVVIVKLFKSSSWNIMFKKMGIVIVLIWVLVVILILLDSLWMEYRRDYIFGLFWYFCI